MGWAILVYFFY